MSLTPSDRFDLEAWRRERKALGFRSTRKQKRTASSSSLSDYRQWIEANEAAHEYFSKGPDDTRKSIASASSLSEYRKWLEENESEHSNNGTGVVDADKNPIAGPSSVSEYGRWLEQNAAAYENDVLVVEGAGRNSRASILSQSEYKQWTTKHQPTVEEEIKNALERQSCLTSQSSVASFHTAAAFPYERVNTRTIEVAPTQRSIIQPQQPGPLPEAKDAGKSASKVPKRSLSAVTKSKYFQYTKTDLLSLKEYLDIQEKKKPKPPPAKRPESMTIKEYIEYQAKQEDLKLGFFFNIKRAITSIPSIFKGFLQTKFKVKRFKQKSKQLQQQTPKGKNKMTKSTSMESVHPKKKRILCPIRRTRAKFATKTKKRTPPESYVHICKDDGIAFPEITVDRHLWIDGGFDTSALSDSFPKGWGIDRLKEVASEYEKDLAQSGYIDSGFEQEKVGVFDHLPEDNNSIGRAVAEG